MVSMIPDRTLRGGGFRSIMVGLCLMSELNVILQKGEGKIYRNVLSLPGAAVGAFFAVCAHRALQSRHLDLASLYILYRYHFEN